MKHFLRIAALLACLIAPSTANAAARFLVACTTSCTWDNSSTLIWSTTSGGAGGSAAPTSSDTVTLDANSCVGGVTCTITVNANLSISSLTMGACTASTAGCVLDFSANNNTFTATTVSITGTGTRTLKMGSNTWTITGTTGTVWDEGVATNLTFNAGTSTLIFSATATGIRQFSGGNQTYFNITVSSPAWSGFAWRSDVTGAGFNANNFTITNVGSIRLAAGSHTITGTVSTNSSSTNQTVISSPGSANATLALGAANNQTLSWVALDQITATGSSLTATNSFDLGGNVLNGGSITSPVSGGGGHIIGG